jgi:hypothetical protein
MFSAKISFYSVFVLTKLVRLIYHTSQTDKCVQKHSSAILNSLILFLDLYLFLRTYAYIVYPFSQEKQQACRPRVEVLITLKEGRKVDVMLTQVKEGQKVVNLKDNPRGLCIGTSHEVTCTLTRK